MNLRSDLVPLVDAPRKPDPKYNNKLSKEERMAFWFDSKGNKRCSRCKKYKPTTEYHKDKGGWGGLCYQCKECAITNSRKHHRRRMKTDPAYREAKKNSHRKARWGMTAEEYEAKLIAQGNKCGICETTEPKGGWHLDHDHTTGKIRKFLCNVCNRGLGYFQDDEEILMKAVNYLQEHSKEGRSP